MHSLLLYRMRYNILLQNKDMARSRKNQLKTEQEIRNEESRKKARQKYNEEHPQISFRINKETAKIIKHFQLEGEDRGKACKRFFMERIEQLEQQLEKEGIQL